MRIPLVSKVSGKAARGLLIGLCAAFLALLLFRVFRLEKQEMASFDVRLRWRAGSRLRNHDRQVLVVAIDEKTLGMMPHLRWPFPRSEYGHLVRWLTAAGVRCIGFDLRFEDADPTQDAALAAALREARNTFLGLRFDPETSVFGEPVDIGHALDHSLVATDPAGSGRVRVRMKGAQLPPRVLAGAARGTGSITIVPETDGAIRTFPLVAAYVSPKDPAHRVHLYASLPLLMAAYYLAVPVDHIEVRLGDSVRIGDRRIPINDSGEMVINYYGPYGSLNPSSYVDVVRGKYEPRYFRDKAVLLGSTHSGGFDIQVTPFGGQYPGVEAEATVVQNILDGSAIRRTRPLTSLLILFAVALAVGVSLAFSTRVQAIVTVTVALGLVALAFWLLAAHYLWIDMVCPLLAVALASAGVSISTFHEASAARARAEGAVDALAEVVGAIAHTRSPAELCQALEKGIGRVIGADGVRLCIEDPWMRERLGQEDAPLRAEDDGARRWPLVLRDKEVGQLVARVPGPADTTLASAAASFAALALENGAYFEESRDHFLSLTLTLADIIESNDGYTAGHCERVMEYACAIGERLALSPRDLEELRFGALLHDVGKTVLDNRILNKPGALSQEEMAEVRRHPELGRQWLRREKRLHGVSELVATHHERWDGAGYPEGLAGEQIPLGGRILAVADVWDALTTDRPYRAALSPQEARRFMVGGRGTQFDPRVIDAFLACLDEDKITVG